jgi:hypothetical protein
MMHSINIRAAETFPLLSGISIDLLLQQLVPLPNNK